MEKKQNLHSFSRCQAIVCDLDGTLYLDDRPFPDSIRFLQKTLASGRRLFYFTNNTSKSRHSYLDKLRRIGFPINDEMLITAADGTCQYLHQNGLAPEIYLIGTRDLESDFHRQGFNCVSIAAIHQGQIPKAVLLAFDTELTYDKIQTGYRLIVQNLPYLATHADILCPMAHGAFIPDVGSFIEMFALASGRRPIVLGKPSVYAVQTICARAQASPEQIAFIGDRLYTDIRMAMNSAMIGVLVLSGETSAEMAAVSPDRPQVQVDGIGDLIEAL